MKTYVQLSALMLLISQVFLPALRAQGPVTPTDGFVGKNEMVMIWDDGSLSNGSNVVLNHEVLELKKGFESLPVNDRVSASSVVDTTGNYSNGILNAASGDFNGDGKDDYVSVSHGINNTIVLMMGEVLSLQTDTLYRTDIPNGPSGVAYAQDTGNIYVAAGDLNADLDDELVLGWVDESDSVNILILDLATNNHFTIVSVLKEEKIMRGNLMELFAISVEDIDENGDFELLTMAYSEAPLEGVYVSVYSVENNSQFDISRHVRQNVSDTIFNDIDWEIQDLYGDIGVGDFDGDSINEIMACFNLTGEINRLMLHPLQISDDESTSQMDPFERITYNNNNIYFLETSWGGNSVDMAVGDLNADGRDEVVAGGNYIHAFYTPAPGNFTFQSVYLSYSWANSMKSLSISNIDNDPANGEEIVLGTFVSNDLSLTAYKLSEAFKISQLAYYNFNTFDFTVNSFALVTGDFDGDVFKIGPGVKYNRTDIVQPIVILNAPPTHFDAFGNDLFDVNNCHDGGECASYATYATTTSQNISVSTTLKKSWGVSTTVSGGGSFLGVSASAYLTGEYGENFEKTSSESTTVTVRQQVTATYDDQIYATVCDYEIWEYPIYDKNNNLQGNILTLEPTLTENRWFPSKERSANGYIPKHEVGNILSYTPYKDLINPDGEDKVRGSYGSDSYDLDANTDVTFSVNLSNTFNNTVVEGRKIGLEAGASVGGWGIEVSGTARYDQSQLSTHSVSVGNALDISVHLGGVNRSIGETGYNVTPYIYWAKNGALVVDYAARPILPEPGGTPTWWSATYNQPDPAFILPWRLDPEKGLILQDEVKRSQTKSIQFSPAEPEAGDTITVSAWVHNFSPYPTGTAIPVSFYVGDPRTGGSLIKGINGNSLFSTSNLIEEQANQKVSFKWKVPENLESFPRIYAWIDPLQEVNEVHEDNNIGWVILGKSDEGGSTNISPAFSDRSNPVNAYPNPAHEELILQFQLNATSDVAVSVFDYNGKRVLQQKEVKILPGEQEFNLSLNGLKAGFYFYRVEAEGIVHNGKFIKM